MRTCSHIRKEKTAEFYGKMTRRSNKNDDYRLRVFSGFVKNFTVAALIFFKNLLHAVSFDLNSV
jgi:hypothetical protein